MATVGFEGTRLHESEADLSTVWNSWGTTSDTIETDYFYQGAGCISCQVKTAQVGVQADITTTVDFTTTPGKAVLFKIIQTNYTAIDEGGLELYIGNDTSNYYAYDIFSATTYPAAGGFQITPIDPIITGLQNSTNNTGTPTDTAIDWYGIRSNASAQAKAPNLGIDALDYVTIGKGLLMDGTSGTFDDFVDTDEGDIDNRWGIVSTRDGIVFVNGTLTIGSGVSQVGFSDSNKVLVFPDTRTSSNFGGIDVTLSHASSSVVIDSCTFNGRGRYEGFDITYAGTTGYAGHTVDSRPNFTVSGVTGTATFDNCSFLNHNEVNFTSAASMNGGRIEARLLTQSSADISNVTIVTDSASAVATLQDPTFGITTDLHDVDFVQGGAGHALELDTATSYSLNGITFTGYGADTTNSAAIFVSATTGTCTINVANGTEPTYRSAGAEVNVVLDPVTLTITVTDIDTANIISGVQILVEVANGDNFPYQDSVTISGVGTTATVFHTAHGLETNDNVVIRGADQIYYNGAYEITTSGVDAYVYTTPSTISTNPATGTITSTMALINKKSDTSGQASDTRTYGVDQLITGKARMATYSPFYKQQPISDTMTSTSNKNIGIQLIRDE